ncbi:MAG: pyruvate formate lyase-activating protein [Thermofilum sp. ex4484_79]|nr:MAG: pyruvate formate lyase-activating protein [Thermofilum sp. ex4484_79]
MWRMFNYRRQSWARKKKCKLCGKEDVTISEVIGVCVDCLREYPDEALKIAMEAHYESRRKFGLPVTPPQSEEGIRCGLCDVNCRVPIGEKGFCGLVKNDNGKLVRLGGTPDRGVLEWYYDPLPTNCVANWFCPGCTGLGYPKYAVRKNGERGYYNLAVFYGACNLDCLFCQNWSYRQLAAEAKPFMSARELAAHADERVTCICFFGGDPSPQVVHALEVAKIAYTRAREEGRIMRICWETNGHFNKHILKPVVDLSLESGGIIKFDLKAWSSPVYKALTGVDVGNVFENAEYVVLRASERPEVPLFTASTLLVPGYVDEYEIRMIARFLASLDRNIPYSLLAYHPDYMLYDLPPTSIGHARLAERIAKEEGLKNVNIGNKWLLGDYY